MKKALTIYGAGGLGREIASFVTDFSGYELIGFYDDQLTPGTVVNGKPVIGTFDDLVSTNQELNVVIAVGDPVQKQQMRHRMERLDGRINFPTLIHPSAQLLDQDSIRLGEGTIITAGCVLTCNISIGRHVLVNLNVTIGHDVAIADFVSVMPGVNLAGNIKIGEKVLIGSGANIINQTTIGRNSVIGAGAVVIRDVREDTTVAGVPARPVRK